MSNDQNPAQDKPEPGVTEPGMNEPGTSEQRTAPPSPPTSSPPPPAAGPGSEQISLEPRSAPNVRTPPPPPRKPQTPEVKDNVREIVETVVFVVVLVLLLKTFIAEAFVIPTGSMATTLLGYHKSVTCEQCGYPFLVNCSFEVDPPPGALQAPIVTHGYCPNCRFHNSLGDGVRNLDPGNFDPGN